MEAPKLVVTVALFTVLGDFNRDQVSPKNIHPYDTSDRTGLSLCVVTRRTNELSFTSDRESFSPTAYDRESSVSSAGSVASYERNSDGRRVLPERPVGQFESIDDAAKHLVAEELGILVPVKLRQTRIFDNPKRDLKERTISVTYWGFANLEDIAQILGGREQVGLELVNSSGYLDRWEAENGLEDFDGVSRFGYRMVPIRGRSHRKFLPEQMGTGPILDQDHDEMVFLSWRKLRYGVTGKMDPFRFLGAKALPDAFRLSDLRELHDVARGVRSQSDQFRRSMLTDESFLERSQSPESGPKRPGKPATLYTLKEWADPERSDIKPLIEDD